MVKTSSADGHCFQNLSTLKQITQTAHMQVRPALLHITANDKPHAHARGMFNNWLA